MHHHERVWHVESKVQAAVLYLHRCTSESLEEPVPIGGYFRQLFE